MASPPLTTKWVPIWPQTDPSPPIPSPVGQDGKWLTVAGGVMVWAPSPAAGLVTPDADWKIVPVFNGWNHYAAPYGPARYRKLASGLVVFNGLVQGSGINVQMIAMPDGYQPDSAAGASYDLIFNLAMGGGVGGESLRMNSDGAGRITSANGQSWTSLAGMSYYSTPGL